MATEWMDNLLNGKLIKEAMESQGTDKQDHFERKVKAHDWIKGVSELDPVAVEAEYIAKLKQEAMTLGKIAALDDVIADGVTSEEVVNRDYKRDVSSLSDYALSELLAEARGHKAQNTNEMYYELKEAAKKEVASSREKAEKALLELIPDNSQLDWQKAFKEFTKNAIPTEPKEKDLFKSEVPEAPHNFNKPTEEKFKVPADQEKAIPGNGREADERKEVTEEAGVLKKDIVEGTSKDASLKTAEKKPHTKECNDKNDHSAKEVCICDDGKGNEKEAHCGECPGDPGMEQAGAPAEDIEKDAAQNQQVVDSFISGEGGARSMNLYIVKGPKGLVLVNYETPIAFRSADGQTYLNNQKYSQTTSGILNKIRQAAGDKVKEVSPEELEQVMSAPPKPENASPSEAAPVSSAIAPMSAKAPQGITKKADACPVCGGNGKDLGNGAKDNMSCEACGITYACASLEPKAKGEYPRNPMENSLENTGIPSAEEIAETFVNGNISRAREFVGGDLDTFMAVMDILGYGSPEGQSFQRIMRKAALKEIKNAATKSQVIQKIAELKKVSEIKSPWAVVVDPETGNECIARVDVGDKNVKESEEIIEDNLVK